MSPSLPSDPEAVKKEARDLLHALRKRHPAALQRYYAVDWLADILEPGLAEAQYTIARERGFASWRKLMESVDNNANSKAATSGA